MTILLSLSPCSFSTVLLLTLSLCSSIPNVLGNVVCPAIGGTESTTRLDANDDNGPNFNAISGLALSSTQVGPSGLPILFGVNDFGGGKRLGVFDSGTGERLLTLSLSSLPSANDWESLAIGSCGVHGEGDHQQCIYIGDTGDNFARPSNGQSSRREGVPYRIYKVLEPIWTDYEDNGIVPDNATWKLEFDYNHSTSPTPFADSEAMFLDHKGWGEGTAKGDLYIITRWIDSDPNMNNNTRLFHFPIHAWSNLTLVYSPEAVGDYSKGGDFFGKSWTMADMTLDGTLIGLGGTNYNYIFPRCPGTSVASALTNGTMACRSWAHPKSGSAHQFETLVWTPNASHTLIMSECSSCNPRMSWTEMQYTEQVSRNIACPEFVETDEPSSASSSDMPSVSPSMPGPTSMPFVGSNEPTNGTNKPSFSTMEPTQGSTSSASTSATYQMTKCVSFMAMLATLWRMAAFL